MARARQSQHMADRIPKRPRQNVPPELEPFIEAMAQLLVSDYIRRKAKLTEQPKRQRKRRFKQTQKLPAGR